MRPLDFVRTPKGGWAIVTEVGDDETGGRASIAYLGGGNPTGEKNAWWDVRELAVVDSLPRLLTREMAHPFGCNGAKAEQVFPL